MALMGVHLFHSLPLDRRSQQLFSFFHVVGIVASCLVYKQLVSTHRLVIESSSSTSLLYLEAGIMGAPLVHCRCLVFLFTVPITFIAVSIL
ncbi:hypothetical protein BDZ97DRAFT_1844679 [Flammula alnicola]|nr:hypothetical protein BDZ97DRAFT_1844679 [Flammula alnicola]